MGKFIKAGRVVVILSGRYAGKKAIAAKVFDDGSKSRPFGHCLVAGVDRAPLKVTRKMSKKKISKRTRVKPFRAEGSVSKRGEERGYSCDKSHSEPKAL
ncbi:unnamed protein product [Polarella glacialis]|uniref:60S ribosomal protein L27 n=1 Tax=Polarella glacialis TaxID=89957 RepID=A0A813LZ58_POLGL|nr:unnamed protein product [Polarella glacialis]